MNHTHTNVDFTAFAPSVLESKATNDFLNVMRAFFGRLTISSLPIDTSTRVDTHLDSYPRPAGPTHYVDSAGTIVGWNQ